MGLTGVSPLPFAAGVTRALQHGAFFAATAVLAACGGGGGGGGGGSTDAYIAPLPVSAARATDSNVALVTVKAGPRNNVNIPYVSVRLCVPGSSSSCKTIDNILLDTGSTGLRVFSSVLGASPALSLPAHSIGGSSTISECAQFLNALAWGPVKLADITIGNQSVGNVALQVLETTTPPSSCGTAPLLAPPSYASSATIAPLSANGILGVSQFVNDGQYYFNCASPASTACPITPSPSEQVQNPVALFSTDNNGVVLQMAAVPATGAAEAPGYLIFGIGTRANNQLGSAHIVPLNSSGFFTTTYKGMTMPYSFMDSGSNGIYFNDPALSTACSRSASGFYCPGSTQNLNATLTLASSYLNVAFSIANSDSLFSGSSYAFNNLGGRFSSTGTSPYFDWGLPFFLGRSVYTAIEGRAAGGRTGPFYAFTDTN